MLGALICLLAALYSAVGHGGASGYLAAMALLGVAPESMRPTALALNVLVATIALVRFYRPTTFAWPMFGWLAIGSVPCAFVGGLLTLPAQLYRPLVGLVLLYAAWQLVRRARVHTTPAVTVGAASITGPLEARRRITPWGAVGGGAGIGLLSGLTGVGGGIFLSPLLLLLGWGGAREVAALAAAFVLMNSLAGLTGHVAGLHVVPGWIALWAPMAVLGGSLGATLGSRRLSNTALQRVLAMVLALAALKLMLG